MADSTSSYLSTAMLLAPKEVKTSGDALVDHINASPIAQRAFQDQDVTLARLVHAPGATPANVLTTWLIGIPFIGPAARLRDDFITDVRDNAPIVNQRLKALLVSLRLALKP